MPNRQLDALGIFVPRIASTLVQPWIPTAASSLSMQTPRAIISDTVEFRHSYLSIPAPSTEDKIIHGLQVVASALTGASPPTSISRVEAITNL